MAITTAKKKNPTAEAFRKTSAGIDLGRKLFNPSSLSSLSPTAITSLLKKAGIDVPGGVQVGADVAQIIMAGGAFSKIPSNAASIGAYAIPVTAVISAVMDIFQEIGLIEKDSPAAMLSTEALLILMVAAGGGMNILADIALAVYTIVNLVFPKDERPQVRAELDSLLRTDARTWYEDRVNAQFKSAAVQFNDYQQGKLSTFEMLGGIALSSPDLFLNYFPEMKTFLPPVHMKKCFYREKNAKWGGIFGVGRMTDTVKRQFCLEFESLSYQTRGSLQNAFVDNYVLQPLAPYRFLMANASNRNFLSKYGYPEKAKSLGVFDHRRPVSRISLMDTVLLSLFPPYFNYLSDDFDVKPFLRALGITPSMLGYRVVEDEMDVGDYGGFATPQSAPFTFNGVDFFTDNQKRYNSNVVDYNYELNQATQRDRAGNIEGLLSLPKAERVVTEWGITPFIPEGMREKIPNVYLAGMGSSKLASDVSGYRNIQNLWATLSTIDRLRADRFFGEHNFREIDSIGLTMNAMQERHRYIQGVSVAKKLNLMARQNVASFYGVAVEKVEFLPPVEGRPGAAVIKDRPTEISTIRKTAVFTQQTAPCVNCTVSA